MIKKLRILWQDKHRVIYIFILSNFAFLSLDIFIAHYINRFSHKAEWLPFYFSIFASILLSFTIFIKLKEKKRFYLEVIVAYSSILMGILGMYFHLESQFFASLTLKNLVYTAPFIAPLSYSGVGFLLLLNNLVLDKQKWSQWIIFLAYGGFLGIFILSLCDHAQNSFFYITEWIPVIASASAVGLLSVIVFFQPTSKILDYSRYLMYLMAIVGVLGFLLHFISLMNNFSGNFFPNFIYGAPLLAPLLFTNIAFLSLVGIDSLEPFVPKNSKSK